MGFVVGEGEKDLVWVGLGGWGFWVERKYQVPEAKNIIVIKIISVISIIFFFGVFWGIGEIGVIWEIRGEEGADGIGVFSSIHSVSQKEYNKCKNDGFWTNPSLTLWNYQNDDETINCK